MAGVASQACSPTGTEGAIVARKASRTYDLRNCLTNLSFPDGNGNQVLTYFNDGKPNQSPPPTVATPSPMPTPTTTLPALGREHGAGHATNRLGNDLWLQQPGAK